MRIRIGLSDTAREIELEVDDAPEFVRQLEDAIAAGGAMVWATDSEQHRYGIVATKVAYVHMEPERERVVGFGG